MTGYVKDAKAYEQFRHTDLYHKLDIAGWKERYDFFTSLLNYKGDESLRDHKPAVELLIKAIGKEKILIFQAISQEPHPTSVYGPEVRTLDGMLIQANAISDLPKDLFTKTESPSASL